MRGEPVFLGVYVKEGISNNAVRWYAWGLPDGKFILQEMERNVQSQQKGGLPGKTSGQNIRRLEPDEFFAEYRVFSASGPKQQPEFPAAQFDSRDGPVTLDGYYGRGQPERNAAGPAGFQADRDGAVPGNAASRRSFSGNTVPGAAEDYALGDNSGFVYLWQSDPSQKTSVSYRYADSPRGGQGSKAQGRNQGSGIPAGEFSGYGNPYGSGSGDGRGADYSGLRGQRETGSAYPLRKRADFGRENDYGAALGRAEWVAKVEEQFRTEFSMALIRLKNKRAEALQALNALVNSEGPFSEEHKFMFTDCGLALRKRNLFSLASQFHLRARELSPYDENILFNLARVMYEAGKIDKAREYLCLSMELAPSFEEGKDFLAFIDGAGIS